MLKLVNKQQRKKTKKKKGGEWGAIGKRKHNQKEWTNERKKQQN